jgi:hypothetical protein
MIISGRIPENLIKFLNRKLKDEYGTTEDFANYRVVWSDDQFEKRKTGFTSEGLQLLTPVVRELPKYRQWVKDKYILERLTVVPELIETDLVEKLSYEPVWVFEDTMGNALRPVWGAIKFILDAVTQNTEHSGYTKYAEKPESIEEKHERIKELQLELFGNETDLGDALAHREGIVVPNGYSSINRS